MSVTLVSGSQWATPVGEVPDGPAGWWHEYVCPTHGTELEADRHVVGGEHHCPHGCRMRGEPYDGAWRVLQHQRSARALRTLGHRYARHGDPAEREAAVTILTAIVTRYAEVLRGGWSESAQPWMLRGRLFHQALTEGIWGTSVADGVCALATGDRTTGRDSKDLAPAAELLRSLTSTMTDARKVLAEDRGDLRNNYTAWLNCAGATAARALTALDHGTPTGPWLVEEAGQYAHLAAAVAADGWEWEGATYYHCFVLRAYLISLAGQTPGALPADVVATLRAMLRAAVDLATDGGVLPVLHDGPYDRHGFAQEVLEACVLGRQLVAVAGLETLEGAAREALGPHGTTLEDELEDWFAGPPVPAEEPAAPRGSVLFPDAGYLVLRPPSGRWQAVVDAGPHGGAHGHRDKLALYLYGRGERWQPAPGVPPYGSPLRQHHYARTNAHPTLRVDDVDQQECTGEVLHWAATPRRTTAVVAADDAYPGTSLRRHLLMEEDLLLDAVHARAESPASFRLGLRPAGRLDVAATERGHSTRWHSDAGGPDDGGLLGGIHVASTADRFEVVPARGPANDPARVLAAVDWSVESDEAWFVSAYRPSDSPAPSLIGLGLSTTPDGGVLVDLTDAAGLRRTFRIHPDHQGAAPSGPTENWEGS